jgi:hypothetical protein
VIAVLVAFLLIAGFAVGWWGRNYCCGAGCRDFGRLVEERDVTMFDRGYRLGVSDKEEGVQRERQPDGSLARVP